MPVVWHTAGFQRGRTLNLLDRYFRLERELGFGTYDLVWRVIHPACWKEVPHVNMTLETIGRNRFFSDAYLVSSSKSFGAAMQINSGLRSFLALPWVYRLFTRVLERRAYKQWFINDVLCLRDGQKLVDVGCGPADILDLLPGVEYVGLDTSDVYIRAARAKFKTRDGAKFLSGSVEDWTRDPLTYEADLVLAHGVLHHIDDKEAKKILEFAHRALKDNGRFIFYEPCYLVWQSRISAYFMSLDRGQSIRTEQQWKELASSVFPVVSTNIMTSVNRLGYVSMVGQCHKSAIANTSSS
jgi:SAM-dependent methyltransferase